VPQGHDSSRRRRRKVRGRLGERHEVVQAYEEHAAWQVVENLKVNLNSREASDAEEQDYLDRVRMAVALRRRCLLLVRRAVRRCRPTTRAV
jgi:hypothetical protein